MKPLHLLVCVYGCIRVYMCVHASHLHGAMPHRFHWGVWEQRLSISSAAVPAGKSLIIISWMMSLRHAPHSRPVTASLRHPPLFPYLSLSLFSLLLPPSIHYLSHVLRIAHHLSSRLLSQSGSLSLLLSLSLYLIPWIWLLLFSLAVFTSLSLSLCSSDTLFYLLFPLKL